MPRIKKEDTEKFSLYLPRELHAKISVLAKFQDMKINDIFTDLANEYVERNRRRLEIFEKAKNDAAALDAPDRE